MMADQHRDHTTASESRTGAPDDTAGPQLPARPDGPIAAALLSAGVGAFALGLCVVLAETSPTVKEALTWSADVGSLSGKTCLATLAYLASWPVLHLRLRSHSCDFSHVMTLLFTLVGLGQLLTFPPFYGLFSDMLP